jgi:hypothetical protein
MRSMWFFVLIVSCQPESRSKEVIIGTTEVSPQVSDSKNNQSNKKQSTQVSVSATPTQAPINSSTIEDYHVAEVSYHVGVLSNHKIGTVEFDRTGSQKFRISHRKTSMPPTNLDDFLNATTITEDEADPNEPLMTMPLRGITLDYDHVWLKFDQKEVILNLVPKSESIEAYRIYRSQDEKNPQALAQYQLYFSPKLQRCRVFYREVTPIILYHNLPHQNYLHDYANIPCAFSDDAEPWTSLRVFEWGSAKAATITIGKSKKDRTDPLQATELSARIEERSVRRMKIQLDRKHTAKEEAKWAHSLVHIFGGDIFQKVGESFILEIDPAHPESHSTMIIYKPVAAPTDGSTVVAKWSLLTGETILEIKNHPEFTDATIILQDG